MLVFYRAAPRAKDVAGVVAEMVGEGVFGLGGERDPVHEEENPGDRAGLEEALDEGGGGAGLAGSHRHLHKELPPPVRHLVRQSFDAVDLVAAVDDLPVDGDVGERTPDRARHDPAFEVVLRVECRNLPRVCVRVLWSRNRTSPPFERKTNRISSCSA